MKVGNLDIGNKLFLAPMAEVTDSSFRKIAKEHGAGITFTQMVSALGVVNNNFDTLRYLSFHRSEKPIGVQVLGNDPEILGQAVKEIVKLNPDLIDLNCGCAEEKVVCNCMGAALLDDPKTVGRIVRKMVDSSNGTPISVKVRLGKDKNNINVLEVTKAIEENGASLIFVHARTRSDKYDTDADWSWLKPVKQQLKIPVVGNGSLFVPDDVKKIIEETGCDSGMIARGALGNPFIFERFNSIIEHGIDSGQPSVDIMREVLVKQIKFLEMEFGESIGLDKAKKHSIWYFKYYSGIEQYLNKIFAIKSLDSLLLLINEHTEAILKGLYKTNDNNGINNKFKKKVLFWLT